MARLKRRGDPMARSPILTPRFWQLFISLIFITACSSVDGKRPKGADSRGICQTTYIRNNVSSLEQLTNCRVIEGNLQIGLTDNGTPEQYRNYSFPDLREITGHFLLFDANGLQTLRHLFPNLAVIRGQDFVYNYGFLITMMANMQEIGLPSLTHVGRGVFFNNNPQLCYVDTIDWRLITNGSQENIIQKNKPSDQCPNTCPDDCSRSDTDARRLCWTNSDCQVVRKKSCNCESGLCYGDNLCCSKQCLGGCSGSGPADCFVCKHFETYYNGKLFCQDHCHDGTYEYSSRCVSMAECSNTTHYDPRTKKSSQGIILNGTGVNGRDKCVLDCPKGHAVAIRNGILVCENCTGTCKKSCQAYPVESSESSKSLKGCTHIKGNLQIQIRSYAENIMNDLKDNLDMIEEIDGSLIVVNSHFITSLEFLSALKVIHGKTYMDPARNQNRFAVEVKSNDNIRELWGNRTVTISNSKSRVLFHYNPKLCREIIWKFVRGAGIAIPEDDKIDIGTTNGDKVPCSQKELELFEVSKVQRSVTLKWSNFRRELVDEAHLLNYEVYYKVSPTQNASIYQDRDVCGKDDWTVLDSPKMNFYGDIHQEPMYEDERIINYLQHFTQYAFYVKTVVIPLPDKGIVSGISRICYITTLPSTPTPPDNVKFSPSSSSSIKIEWLPPESPNGIIERYEIFIQAEEKDVKFQNQRDYCLQGKPTVKVTKKEESPLLPSFINPDCCSCSATPTKKRNSHDYELHIKDVQDSIINSVYLEGSKVDPEPEVKSVSRRRKRRSVDPENFGNDTETSAERETNKNYVAWEPDNVQPPFTVYSDPLGAGMILIKNVSANDSRTGGGYEIFLEDLLHFSRYTIGIRACRENKTYEQVNGCKDQNSTNHTINDSPICSDLVKETVTTLHSPSADLIDVSTIRYNVSDKAVTFYWKEPKEPNGIAMAYRVNVTRVDAVGTGEVLDRCVNKLDFDRSGSYRLHASLNPGNYSVRVQVISLAPLPFEANYSSPIFFTVLKREEGMTPGLLVGILLPIAIVIIMGVGVAIYVVRTRRKIDKIISANPEYLQNVDIPEEWEVPHSNIILGPTLGKGSFGMVYKGTLKLFRGKINVPCAIKTVAENSTSDDRYRFLKEASMMTKMECHHVVKLLGVVSLSRPTYVIMELMEKGDLKEYLIKCRENPPTLRDILQMSAGIADGMAYLDDHKFVHRDLAARNCMVADDMTVKVGDFGMTKDVVETDYYRKETRGFLPVRWMAPESIREGVFSIQSDVWSFGVVLWEMATLAAQPYQGLENEQVLRYIRDGGTMEKPDNCPDVLYDMMCRCWHQSPFSRPTFADILDWLQPELKPSFAQTSFYHSPAGIKYRAGVQARIAQEEIVTIRTPLRATFDEDFEESDENEDDEVGSDSELHSMSGRRRPVIADKMNSSLPTLVGTANLPTAFPQRGNGRQLTNNNILHPNPSPSSDFLLLQDRRNSNNSRQENGNSNSNPNSHSPSPSSRYPSPLQTTSPWVSPSESANVGVRDYTPKLPPPTQPSPLHSPTTTAASPLIHDNSSNANSIAFSPPTTEASKLLCNGNGPPGYNNHPFSNPTSGTNGYVTLKHSPTSENNAKSRTTQF